MNLLKFHKTTKKSKSDELKLPVKEVNNIPLHVSISLYYQQIQKVYSHEYILFAVLSFSLQSLSQIS